MIDLYHTTLQKGMRNMIEKTSFVNSIYPDEKVGVMTVKGLSVAIGRSAMNDIIADEIERIKSKYPDYERKAVLETKPLCRYADYYKRFNKTYHVLGQLESVLVKGKGIPPVGVSVEVMFLAEIKNLLLTAGHDLDLIEGGLTIDVVTEPIGYQGISGKERQLSREDLYLSDKKGVLSSIMSGPDYRTRITEATQNALYFVYGVPGVTETQIRNHLETISTYLLKAVPDTKIQSIDIF
jgi:DNA/RNA-binding domain of Phe-tRNA-synthetase-like protein